MQTPPLFDPKGKFIGLADEQIAKLNLDQKSAYDELAAATAQLDTANAEYVAARDHHHASVRALQEAQANQTKQRQWTHMDEWRSMIAAGKGLPDDKTLLKQAMVKVQMSGKELTEENLRAELPPGFILEIDADDKPSLFDRQEKVSESTVRMRLADERVRECRGRVAECITRWQTIHAGNFEGLIREHIANENRLRAERVASGQSRVTGHPGPSEIDRFAFYTKQSGRRAGGGGSFRRGGYTPSEAARINAERARQAKQTKP